MRSTAVGLTLVLAGALVGCSHESADWKAASTANTPEAYQQFLQQHASGADADQARERIKQLSEDHDWQVAAAADTRQAYEQFVAQYPDSKWAQEARIRIENFAQAAAGAPNGTPPQGAGASGSPAPGAAPTAAAPGTGNAAAANPSAATLPHIQTPNGALETPPAAAAPHASAAHTAVAATRSDKHAGSKPAQHAASTASSAGRLVQLGAFHSKASAESEWKTLTARFPTQLKKLRPLYVASKSKSGQIYRLQVRVASPSGAKDLCTTLKRHALSCVPVTATLRQPHVTA